MLGLGCVPALALGFGMLRMPQSPRWLVMTRRRLRGAGDAGEDPRRRPGHDRPRAGGDQGEPRREARRLERAAAAGGESGARGRRRAGDPAAGDRHQHRHLLRADDRRIHRRQLASAAILAAVGVGVINVWRRSCWRCACSTGRGRRDAAAHRRHRHVDLALRPRRRLQARRRWQHAAPR